MTDFVSALVEMGFDKEKSAMAVEKTESRGVEAAMEWMLTHPDEPSSSSAAATGGNQNDDMTNKGGETEGGGPATTTTEEDAVPKSYKCEDCGKLFSSMDTVEFHAAKTNHSNFSESTEEKKPLTPEEKAEQSKKLLELMKLKRAEREAKERLEAIEAEKRRMVVGKEIGEARRYREEQEMKEIIELRKREKIEEKVARDRVKAQIEADKIARRAKFGGGSESPSTTTVVAAPPPPPAVELPPQEKKDYTETKLQIRLPNGKTLVQTFGVQEPLASVRLYIELHRTDGGSGPFNLMTNYPKKVYSDEDYDTPLAALGLVPSAVLMVTRTATI